MSKQDDNIDKPKVNPDKLRHDLYWLALDWVHLHNHLPIPPLRRVERTSNTREYGHPAEWASDRAADIADILHSWHDLLAEHRAETPPPNGSEQVRVVAAWQYLETRCDQLAYLVDPDDLREIPDLHFEIRRRLGHTNPKYTLPIPCPNDECGLRTLARITTVGRDWIECGACGYAVKEEHYPLLIRMTLDTLIDSA